MKPLYIQDEDPIVWSLDYGVMHVVHIPDYIWRNPGKYGSRTIRNIYRMRLWVAHIVMDDPSLRYVYEDNTYGITLYRLEDMPVRIQDGTYHGLSCRENSCAKRYDQQWSRFASDSIEPGVGILK